MSKSPENDAVGDRRTPPLTPQHAALRGGVDQADRLVAEAAAPQQARSTSAGLAAAARKGARLGSPTDCRQQPWLSFFFDGTGNNLDADIGTARHSNVAKLYRVHQEDDLVNGVYRVYIPGVGTYFSEVGDDGGSTLGLGSGRMGDRRLEWALKKFDQLLAPHIARASSPANCIREINVALFGFSRGAALARAFSNMLLKERCTKTSSDWRLKQGQYPVRIRFMGLFDTVASVGLPMSTNNISKAAAPFGVKHLIGMRLAHADFAEIRPSSLAFAEGGVPGADPAPGAFDGHQDWGDAMAIPDMVEHVRHFVSAHEIRNSFPLDSISVLRDGKIYKPPQFHETVFPGVHSDIGGSYRAGEGGRSVERTDQLGLIPLDAMYRLALENHVPLEVTTAWKDFHDQDFERSKLMLQRYNYYQSKVGGGAYLGPLVNAHMSLYFAWKFRSIHRKQQGNRDEANEIANAHAGFEKETAELNREIEGLEKINSAALRDLNAARQRRLTYVKGNYGNPNLTRLPELDAAIHAAQVSQKRTQNDLLLAKARRDALPSMGNLNEMVDMYDAQLLVDARAIREVYAGRGVFAGAPDSARRDELRPHYKLLVEAYENEFVHGKGLQDKEIIAFFDLYVHDSLSGFAKDATLPSDPRVIYLGGDEKYRYAHLDRESNRREMQYAGTNDIIDDQRADGRGRVVHS